MIKSAPLFATVLWFCLISCNGPDKPPPDTDSSPAVPSMSYSILKSYPHDTANFTEGLEFYNNTLLESTGLAGKSRLVQVDPVTGKVMKEVKLDPKFFGEGITVLRDTIYQLTYKENLVHLYAAKDFKKIGELPYTNGEG